MKAQAKIEAISLWIGTLLLCGWDWLVTWCAHTYDGLQMMLGFHVPSQDDYSLPSQCGSALSDEGQALMLRFAMLASAGGITLGARHQDVEPYRMQACYDDEMLFAPPDWTLESK